MRLLKLVFFLSVFFTHFRCSKEVKVSESLVFCQNQKSLWIQDKKILPKSDAEFYLDDPAPQFRKTFFLSDLPKKATLFITAAGYYKSTINTFELENNILDPAWTDYSKRIYYKEYDITELLTEGMNCLGVSLGNGFYNPLPLKMWGRINLRENLSVGKPRFIAKLRITHPNGKTEEIVSDSSWKYSYGPIIKNSVYLGTHYDARKELKGWNHPDFNDSDWENAITANPPGGKLQKAFFPPIKINKKIEPQKIYSTKNGKWMVDMGENFTGTYYIKLNGKKGDKITFRFGELIYEDGSLNPMTSVIGQIKKKGTGGPGAPDVAWQTNSYIIGDENPTWFRPDFTYHAFRFMEIDGLSEKPKKSEIMGLSIHTAVDQKNHFTSSTPLLNEIQKTVRRTFLANLVGVQSDCPAREKFGYGGDLNATSASFIYNFDMQSFYKKTVYDWSDAINDSTFVDTAPNVGIQYCGISWESAFLITQYQLYLYYNDLDFIKEMYPLNQKWMDKVSRLHPEGIVDKGLSDHESLSPVPVELIGTLHYLQTARIMRVFAGIMEDRKSQSKYHQLSLNLENKIRETFWKKSIKGTINRQTLFASLLHHKIIPEDQIHAAKDSLKSALQKAPAQHLTTGIFGTAYALEAISEYLSPQIIFNIVNNTDFPGWGYMIKQGATTLWETWKESDNIYSNSHPMFGSITEWFFRWLGGIRPDPKHPGFKKFFIKPYTPEGLDSISTSYIAPHGKIISQWTKRDRGYRYEITVPEGSVAQVELNKKPYQKINILKGQNLVSRGDKSKLNNGRFNLESGAYVFWISP
ncbi:MAG: family 78 glycoside hydrolase catalytic domain [Flavobacteriaceae bacterium]